MFSAGLPGKDIKMKIDWKTCLRVGISAFVVYLGIHYWSGVSGILKTVLGAAVPLIIGCFIAYLLNIMMSFYERHLLKKSTNKFIVKKRRAISLTLTLLTLAGTVALVLALVIPQLIDCVKLLIVKVPGVIETVLAYVDKLGIIPEDIFAMISNIDWKSKIGDILSTLTSGVGSAMSVVVSTVSSVVSGVTTATIAIIFAIYVVLGKDKISGQIDRVARHYISQKIYDKIKYILTVADECFHKFIVGQCTEAIILGALCALGMFILRLPYAAMMGAVTAFTALIPIIGALLGGAIGVFLIFMESPVQALIFLVFIIILQQLEGDLIYPKVVGTSIGLPGIWVFTVATLGGGVFGIIGMIASVPIAATLYRLLRSELNGETKLVPLKVQQKTVVEVSENTTEAESEV